MSDETKDEVKAADAAVVATLEDAEKVAAADVAKLDEKPDEETYKGYVSASMVKHGFEERKRVYLVTFATMAAAASYILMLFIAMPLSIHTIINKEEGCDPDVDEACFAPIERSQTQLTLTLTLLRISTFIMGSLVGTVSDRFGRKPLLVTALLGYTTSGILFIIGWGAQNVNFFVVGAIVLGASSPVLPHGIAYVSDVSYPNRLAVNLGILEGFGYFIGLMFGALFSLGIGLATTGVKDDFDGYSKLFYGSFAAGVSLSAVAAMLTVFFLPESLHPSDRTKYIDWKKANPFGFLPLISRNVYFFLIWMSGMFAWSSIGSQESTAGGWWLRRYAISDTNVFIQFTVLLWVVSGIGAAICTKIYVLLGGLKFAVHVSAIMTILIGVAFALAPTAKLSYIAVGGSFFASAVLPSTIALLMGQVDSKEKGTLAGAIRSSEALAKFIGILVVGNSFAGYIAPFTPDQSCVPATYDGRTNKANTCDCGVKTCPDLILNTDANGTTTINPVFMPSECSLGQLSMKVLGKPSKYIDFIVPEPDTRPVPEASIDIPGGIHRPGFCKGAGLEEGLGGITVNLAREYCLSELSVGPFFNQELGCPGFDLGSVPLDLAYFSCEGKTEPDVNCTATDFATFLALEANNYTTYYSNKKEITDIYLNIYKRVLDPNFDDPVCEDEFDKAEYNLCLDGPISSFPGLYPMMFMGLLAVLGYASFLIAETFFSYGDQRYWTEARQKEENVDEDVVEEEAVMEATATGI